MDKDNYVALRAARDAACEEHRTAIRWALNRIDKLEKQRHEVQALVRAIRRVVGRPEDSDDEE
jgi:hypothetical protein